MLRLLGTSLRGRPFSTLSPPPPPPNSAPPSKSSINYLRSLSLKKIRELRDLPSVLRALRNPPPDTSPAAILSKAASDPARKIIKKKPTFPFVEFDFSAGKIRPSWIIFGVSLFSFLGYHAHYHSEAVPISGRKRINWLPKFLEESFMAGVDQFWLGETENKRLETSSQLHNLVENVGNTITKANNLKRLTYHVVASDELNAFVTPGGHVFVFTGMFQILETKDDLAIVLGHEMSHKLAKHTIDGVLVNLFVNSLRLLLDFSSNVLNAFAEIVLTLPYSRSHETEADYMGLILATRAGYDPNRAALLWTRMAMVKNGEGVKVTENNGVYEVDSPTVQLDSYLSTHPSDQERIRNFSPGSPWMIEATQEWELYKQRIKEQQEKEKEAKKAKGGWSFF